MTYRELSYIPTVRIYLAHAHNTHVSGSESQDFWPPFFLVNQHFMFEIFSFIIDVFTPKRISTDCPFKSNLRQVDFVSTVCSLSLRCDAHHGDWLSGGMQTAEIIWAVCCTPLRFVQSWSSCLRGGMHTAEIVSAVCIPQRKHELQIWFFF